MKWFRHETNAHDDEKIDAIRQQFGMEGIGIWWQLTELVAQNYSAGKDPSRIWSWVGFQLQFSCKRAKTKNLLNTFQELGLIETETVNEKTFRVTIPKLSKFCDVTNKRKMNDAAVSAHQVSKTETQNATPPSHLIPTLEKNRIISPIPQACRTAGKI